MNQIYHTNTEIQPKLLVLKLYMLLGKYKSNGFYKVISQTNIVIHVIQQITQKYDKNNNSNNHDDVVNLGDTKIMKAYIDFLVEMYGN